MMSDPEGNTEPPTYEAIMSNSEPTAPMSNVPLTNIPKNDSPPPPAYYPPNPDPTWSPYSVIPPWSVDNITPQNTDPSPPFYKAFLMGKPKALGVLIIVVSVFEVSLGIALVILAVTNTELSGISFWGPIFYIIAGFLTLYAHGKPSISLVKGSLALSVISCVLTVIAVVLNVIDLATVGCYIVYTTNDSNNVGNGNYNNAGHANNNEDDSDFNDIFIDHNHNNHNNNHNNQGHGNDDDSRSSFQTMAQCTQRLDSVYAILALLLITNVLLSFVTLIISVFGCRSLSERNSTAPQVYVIPNDVIKKPDAFPEFPPQSPPQPPPYTATEVKATPTY